MILLAFGVRVEDGVAWGPSCLFFGGMVSVSSCSHAALKGCDAAGVNMTVAVWLSPTMSFMPRLTLLEDILPFKSSRRSAMPVEDPCCLRKCSDEGQYAANATLARGASGCPASTQNTGGRGSRPGSHVSASLNNLPPTMGTFSLWLLANNVEIRPTGSEHMTTGQSTNRN